MTKTYLKKQKSTRVNFSKRVARAKRKGKKNKRQGQVTAVGPISQWSPSMPDILKDIEGDSKEIRIAKESGRSFLNKKQHQLKLLQAHMRVEKTAERARAAFAAVQRQVDKYITSLAGVLAEKRSYVEQRQKAYDEEVALAREKAECVEQQQREQRYDETGSECFLAPTHKQDLRNMTREIQAQRQREEKEKNMELDEARRAIKQMPTPI